MTKPDYKKKSLDWELAYSFRGFTYDCHGVEHGDRQTCRHAAGAVAEASYPDLQTEERKIETDRQTDKDRARA